MHDMGFEPRPLSIGDIPAQMRKQAAVGIGAGWGDKSLRLLMISASVRGVFLGWAFYASQPYFLELLDRDAVWIVGLITAGASLATIAGNQIVERGESSLCSPDDHADWSRSGEQRVGDRDRTDLVIHLWLWCRCS